MTRDALGKSKRMMAPKIPVRTSRLMFLRGSKMGKAAEDAVVIESNDDKKSAEPGSPLAKRKLRADTLKTSEHDDDSDRCNVLTNGSDDSDDDEVGEKALRVGDRVEAKYRGRGRRYYTGVIAAVQSSGSYDVDYDDGDRDLGLLIEFVRRLPLAPRAANHENQQERDRKKSETMDGGCDGTVFQVEQRIEARYCNRGRRYYKGKITDALPDDLYNITYDDGDKDRHLPANAIRALVVPSGECRSDESGRRTSTVESTEPLERPSTTDGTTSATLEDTGGVVFQRGQTVECRYKGRGRRWYKGTVTEGLSNGTYNIGYTDGNQELGLSATHIRAVEVPPGSGDSRTAAHVSDTERAFCTNQDEDTARARKVGPSEAVGSDRDGGNDRNWTVAKNPHMESSNAEEVTAREVLVASSQDEVPRRRRLSAPFAGRGNRLHRGVVSRIKVVYLYEVEYEDGTRDVNVPCGALRAREENCSLEPGTAVDVLSWQDRFSTD